MSKVKLLLFAVLALFAFSAVSAAVASAEDPNSPELLILEGTSVTKLEGKFKGGASELATLGGKTLTGTEVTATEFLHAKKAQAQKTPRYVYRN